MTEPSGLYLTVFWWTLGGLGVTWVLLAGALFALRGRVAALSGGEGPRSVFDVLWTVAPAVLVLLVVVPAVRGTTATAGAPADAEAAEEASGAMSVPGGVWSAETEKTSADAAAKLPSGESLTPDECCATVRQETTEEDDTEQDDLVN